MKTVFFYGLFMDHDLLQKQGLKPTQMQRAYLPDYQLQIGRRATLVRHEGACSYGILMKLNNHELKQLYGNTGVTDYLPQIIQAQNMSDEIVMAITYLLPLAKLTGSNSGYAVKLANLAKELKLPVDYIREIEGWI